jgi:DNA-binding XRE family transcriptional regulator
MKKRPIRRANIVVKESLTADEFYEECFGDRPKWSVFLLGLRTREDMTQKEFSKLIGVKQGDLSKMERGLRPIGKELAKRIAGVFKVDYRIFL